MGRSGELQKGQWCLTIGHPGGFQTGRTPVVRLGRILEVNGQIIRSDCPLVGGDSGGPLFDLEGRVIGIHSRIGESMTANIHVPVDTYRDTWERLAGGEVWGNTFPGGKPNGAYLGFRAHPESKECRVVEVFPGSPAEKGGLKVDDVITRFGGEKIDTFEELRNLLDKMKPGQEVTIAVQRDEEVVILKFVLGKRN
jgi:serine protease Do